MPVAGGPELLDLLVADPPGLLGGGDDAAPAHGHAEALGQGGRVGGLGAAQPERHAGVELGPERAPPQQVGVVVDRRHRAEPLGELLEHRFPRPPVHAPTIGGRRARAIGAGTQLPPPGTQIRLF